MGSISTPIANAISISTSVIVLAVAASCGSSASAIANSSEDLRLRLRLVNTGARLPIAMAHHSLVYDGQNAVYVIGGWNCGTYQNKVIKYDLKLDELSVIGDFGPPIAFGVAAMDGDDILYFGGHTGAGGPSSAIYRNSIANRTCIAVQNLPLELQAMGIAWDSTTRTAYLLGGYKYVSLDSPHEFDGILEYSATNDTVKQLGTLTEPLYGAATIWDSSSQTAVSFGGRGGPNSPNSNREILQIDPHSDNGNTKQIANLPIPVDYACAALVEAAQGQGHRDTSVYVMGGQLDVNSSNVLIRFNFSIGIGSDSSKDRNGNAGTSVEVLDVESWKGTVKYSGCVYVPRLDRIYIVGGFGSFTGNEPGYRDEIMYLDLTMRPGSLVPSDDRKKLYVLVGVIGLALLTVVALAIGATVAPFCPWRQRQRKSKEKETTTPTPEPHAILRLTQTGAPDEPDAVTPSLTPLTLTLTPSEIEEFRQGAPPVPGTENEYKYTSRSLDEMEMYAYARYDEKHELDTQKLTVDTRNVLGSGQFGIVYKGTYESEYEYVGVGDKKVGVPVRVPVAVKTLRTFPNANAAVQLHDRDHDKGMYIKSLLAELKILTFLGPHPHLVNLVGAHTTQLEHGSVLLVTELCPLGDLETFLRTRKGSFQNCDRCGCGSGSDCDVGVFIKEVKKKVVSDPGSLGTQTNATSSSGSTHSSSYVLPSELDPDPISTCDLFLWSSQTASAMCFLSQKRITHGDLAARNILLRDKSCAKLTDFGLGRKLYAYTYLTTTSFSASSTTTRREPPPLLPWRSLAPECLTELKFSIQSDVWAFGVTLWELFSLGRVPFTAATAFSDDFAQRLVDGLRLPKPIHASEGLYREMWRCWHTEPDLRPSFPELHSKIEEMQSLCLPKPSIQPK